MFGFMHSTVRRLEGLEEAIAIMLLAATSAFVVAAASGRAIGHPLPWCVDFAQLAFIWTCVFSADMTLRRHGHIRIDLLLLKLSAGPRKIVEVLIVLLELALLVGLVKYGIELALSNWLRPLGATGISYGWVTVAMPFGASLMIITLLRQFHQLIFNRKPTASDAAEAATLGAD